MTTTTLERVKDYQGQNSFVIKMKEVIQKYGSLTPNQLSAVEKCLLVVNSVNTGEVSDEIKAILDYTGENSFVKEIASKFGIFGSLTQKQIDAATKQIQKENKSKKMMKMNWGTPGETILIGRTIGQQLKETYNLEFNPTIIDITRLLGVSEKAVKFAGKMTVKRGKVCVSCNKTLTDEFSMLTNMGKICAKHMKVEYITDASQADSFRERYLKRVEEIGEMEFWIPKTQIKKWDGRTESFLRMI